MKVLAIALLACCGLTACDDGPSCDARGGHVVQDTPIYIPPTIMMVGKVPVAVGGGVFPQSHCEMPK